MCTVTFVRSGSKVIITSNRDEDPRRPALQPESYNINGSKLYFPQDPQAGGTWFAVSGSADAAVLLNGAFQKHNRSTTYRKSRGLILLDVLSQSDTPLESWKEIDLVDVEPFTIVLYASDHLFQLTWDGERKHEIEMDSRANHIWSSATLYDKDQVAERQGWFEAFNGLIARPDEHDILKFHRSQSENVEYGFVMNRGFVKTVSITQVVLEQGTANLRYFDLERQQESIQTLSS